jgi:hypothetical protein
LIINGLQSSASKLGRFLPEKQKFIIYSDWLWKSFLCSMAAFVGIAGRFSTRKGEHPFDYLKDLFTRLPAAKITEIRAFTPATWAKAREETVAQAV